ncbi:MAG: FGGY-family carbohydrate kinase [Spirochaetes bacterium]|nr:FGGY-family carbohydrate kinase [Spirochaetota bacterium]
MGHSILCIDVGTSSLKGGVFKEDGKVLQLLRIPLADPGTENFHRFDPRRWEKAFKILVGSLNTLIPDRIIFSGQGPSLVPIDAMGNPTFFGLLWLDGREHPVPGGKSLFLPKARWFQENARESFVRTTQFLTCPEYLVYQLTGEKITVSPSEEFDPYYWNGEELDRYRLPAELFPPLIRPGSLVGKVSKEGALRFGLMPDLKVYAGGPDYLMSLLGTATTKVGRTCDRAGTSEGINVCIPTPVQKKGLRCLPHLVHGLYTLAGMLTSSGRLFEWFRELTNQKTLAYDQMMGAIQSLLPEVQKTPGRVPSFFPFAQPGNGWDFSRGIFVGLGTEHGKAELGFAVIEAIGYAVRSTIERLEQAGCHIDVLRVSGGQANNRIWNHMKASIVGKPLMIPQVKDAELLGGLAIVHTAEGGYKDFVEAADQLVRFDELIEPSPTLETFFRERYEQYRERCGKLMDVLGDSPS